jgi:2-aminoadipate transaminase
MATLVPTLSWEDTFARRMRGAGGEITAILARAGATEMITFSGGFPAPETFPTDELSGVVKDLFGADAWRAMQYAPTPGLPGLRDVMIDRLETTQGQAPADGELLITSGGIDAMALIGRALLDQGDLVAVESPTYLGAITAFAAFEADMVGIPMDAQGLDVEALGRRLATGRKPKLLYTIPDHHNPTGLSLPAARRHALVELCRRHGLPIVEDVAYRELGAGAAAAPSLWSLAPELVVQIGTFSKTFFPGVRLGWAVGPQPLIRHMVTAKQNTDQCAGALGQRLAEEYLRSGDYDAQLPRSRHLYNERRAATLEACAAHLPPGVTWTVPQGGFFTWLSAPIGVDTVAMSAPAEASGVAYVPGPPFYVGAGLGRNQLRLAYSRTTTAEIGEGVRRLAQLLASTMAAA